MNLYEDKYNHFFLIRGEPMYYFKPSKPCKQLVTCCDEIAAIDTEIRRLKHQIDYLDREANTSALISAWKMGADAIRSTADHHANTYHIEKIESIQTEIDNLNQVRKSLVNKVLYCYQHVNENEKEPAAIVLQNFCGITEPLKQLKFKSI